ncbi:MAG TPA: hypothetical protein H9754_12945 [Candidatus Anaerostipes avistercoris]|uniref:Uncharacterized protein n=1 Tax=Candidatus Anaerostipes avistercoris TaxID=2838462 RepID=A0A9D2PM46_9FIRM|nr:hypothetical protein [uncultured Anaerostipes sp.]HJC51453.1 hypothetical protein [Candidatus Anaerostipes avistercoris]
MMDNRKEQMENLEKEFKFCQKILNAIGDETRQHLLIIMMTSGECSGSDSAGY